MKTALRFLAALTLLAAAPAARAVDEILDRLSDALTVSAFDGNVRLHLSGLLDLEGYILPEPAPGLFFTEKRDLFNPRGLCNPGKAIPSAGRCMEPGPGKKLPVGH